MSRTNIDIDDELIAEFMRNHNVRTKREAVDLALRLARRPRPMTREEMLELRGVGWEGDLEEIKTSRVTRWLEEGNRAD